MFYKLQPGVSSMTTVDFITESFYCVDHEMTKLAKQTDKKGKSNHRRIVGGRSLLSRSWRSEAWKQATMQWFILLLPNSASNIMTVGYYMPCTLKGPYG